MLRYRVLVGLVLSSELSTTGAIARLVAHREGLILHAKGRLFYDAISGVGVALLFVLMRCVVPTKAEREADTMSTPTLSTNFLLTLTLLLVSTMNSLNIYQDHEMRAREFEVGIGHCRNLHAPRPRARKPVPNPQAGRR